MAGRKEIPQKITKELWIKSGGRCELCNKDLTSSYLSRNKFWNNAQEAHIVAYSENGPRSVEMGDGDNSYDNLMLLCMECHKTIDSDPDSYPVEYLKRKKREHCETVKKVLDMITKRPYTLIEYSSTVFSNNDFFNRESIYAALVDADIYCDTDTIVLEDKNDESKSILDTLSTNFDKRVRNEWNRGESPDYCIFAMGPIYALMKLGSMFSNYKSGIKVAIRTRQKWILDEKAQSIDFIVNRPVEMHCENDVVMELNVTAKSNVKEIKDNFNDMDHWSITIDNPGVDVIKDLSDVRSFGKIVVNVLDEIKRGYHEGVSVHVVPRINNALAVQFGISLMPKIRPSLHIYDITKEGIKEMCDLN